MKFKQNEFWRDVETLGSFAFYAAVIIRSLVGWHWPFFWQLVAALAISQVVLRMVGTGTGRKISSHASNGGALLVLINAFYHSWSFLVFSLLAFALSCIGHQKLRKHTWGEIASGLAIGILAAGLVWWALPVAA